MSPTTQQGDDQGNLETEHNTGSTQEQMSTPSINSLEDLISIIGQLSREGEAYRTLHLDAEKLWNAKQNELGHCANLGASRFTQRTHKVCSRSEGMKNSS